MKGNFIFLLTSSSQEWQFHIATDIYLSGNSNLTLLVTSSGEESGNFTISTDISWSRNGNYTLLLTSSGQEWYFHLATHDLVVKNGNFTLLLTSTVQVMAISHCY